LLIDGAITVLIVHLSGACVEQHVQRVELS
jgi:hypothetical protein